MECGKVVTRKGAEGSEACGFALSRSLGILESLLGLSSLFPSRLGEKGYLIEEPVFLLGRASERILDMYRHFVTRFRAPAPAGDCAAVQMLR